ncbi:MAG TPA: protein-disulfide reductase DsbD [Steroidobacteraceae bacterium]|nr:protein-disulfide reductase DsbD [Steroidobacteraceae bacterium]
MVRGTWLLLAAVPLIQSAEAKDDFLSPDKAYRYTTRVEGDRLIVAWDIEKGYYLYKKKMGVVSASPDAQLGEPQWPKGEDHTDEYFGTQEVYRGKVEVPVPIVISGARPAALNVELRLQGCADAGLCYPPQKWKTEVKLPVAAGGGGLSSLLGKKSAAAGNQNEFLPPDEAFRFGVGLPQADSVPLTWVIADGYYLYKDRITIESATPNVQIGKPVLPKGKPKHDEYFGDTEVYYEVLEATLPVARAASSEAQPLKLKVTYQGCAEGGLCYNPITKEATIELPPTNVASALPVDARPAPSAGAAPVVAEQDSLANIARTGGLGVLVAIFFVGGLALSFTPCVLPMIPILSGIIVGQGDRITPWRGFSLAFIYVQGMALMYAVAGAIAAALFGTAPQATFQQPWILSLFALLFVALAFAMFGAYNLQLPSSLQTRLTNLSNNQKAGTFVGTFIMGALSALIVTACVAPVVVGALSLIAQSGSTVRGALALYAAGIGMGAPLLLVGASAGALLPKVGPWMDTVKQLFGVMFLGVAIYVLNPVLPEVLSMLLWSVLAIISGFWIFSLRQRDGSPVPSPVRGVGLLILIWGILLLIGVGAGGRDPTAPLANARQLTGAGAVAAPEHAVAFRRIKSVADLEREVAAATAAGKPVMLDFYADWCASCKEMEKYTFPDPQVQALLAGAVLLQADVTKNDDDDRALLNRFEIFGPPTIAFFGSDGVERKNFRLVGFAPAPRFAEHVKAAFAS